MTSLLGKADINISKRFGSIPTFNTLANGLAEPLTVGHQQGSIILAIRTKGELSKVNPKPGDVDYHPSYPSVVRAYNPDGSIADVETLIFNNSYDAIDLYPKVRNSKGIYTSFEDDYMKTYGDYNKARAAYLGYMGGRSKMATSVSENIQSKASGRAKVEPISVEQKQGAEAWSRGGK